MNTKPQNVSTSDFSREVLQAKGPVVVDFWAPWCGPCRQIGPVLEDLAERYAGDIKVVKVNVDEEPTLASQFGVRGIPTLCVVEEGEVTGQQVGFSGAAALEKLFKGLASHEAA